MTLSGSEIMPKNLTNLLTEYIQKFGQDSLEKMLTDKLLDNEENNLTIIANSGKHHIPEKIIKGEKYIFSEGYFEIQDLKDNDDIIEVIKEELKENITKLSDKLRSKTWDKIYLILMGHSINCSHIKHLVYRITRKETLDICYFPEHGYIEIDLNLIKHNLYNKSNKNLENTNID